MYTYIYVHYYFLDLLLQNCCTAIAECWKTAFTRVIRQFLRTETGVHTFRTLQWEFLFRNYASLKNSATPAVSVPLIVSHITLASHNRSTKLQRARERERYIYIYITTNYYSRAFLCVRKKPVAKADAIAEIALFLPPDKTKRLSLRLRWTVFFR